MYEKNNLLFTKHRVSQIVTRGINAVYYSLLVITKARGRRRASPTNVTVLRKVITALLFCSYYDETASERKPSTEHLHYFYKTQKCSSRMQINIFSVVERFVMEMAFYRTGDYHFNYNLLVSCDTSNDLACTVSRRSEKIDSRACIYRTWLSSDFNIEIKTDVISTYNSYQSRKIVSICHSNYFIFHHCHKIELFSYLILIDIFFTRCNYESYFNFCLKRISAKSSSSKKKKFGFIKLHTKRKI